MLVAPSYFILTRMINKRNARHFQACESAISRLITIFRPPGSVKERHHSDRPCKTTRRKDIDNVASPRCNRFLSSIRIPGLSKKCHGMCQEHMTIFPSVRRVCNGNFH